MEDKLEKVKLILKNTHVNFMLGAGASYNKVYEKLSYPLMGDLLNHIKSCKTVEEFLKELIIGTSIDASVKSILIGLFDRYLFAPGSDIETFLSVLEGVDLYIYDEDTKTKMNNLQDSIKKEIRERLKRSDDSTVLDNYLDFYNGLKWLKEITSIKNQSFNVFTTNYDMLNEKAMETLNIHYYSGFEGIVDRNFNLVYYNYNFTDNFEVNKNSIQVNANHINLFKLHGSISWKIEDGKLKEKNPYDLDFIPEIIYPSINKFSNTNLIINYSALMREFSNRLCRKNTTLVVSGTSMGDEHINKIIENALTINSFNMIIFAHGNESQLENLNNKYKNYKNVIVMDESYTFEQLSELLLSLNGGNHNE